MYNFIFQKEDPGTKTLRGEGDSILWYISLVKKSGAYMRR